MRSSVIARPTIIILGSFLLALLFPGFAAADTGQYRNDAAAASRSLMEDLAAELMREMQAGGPPSAIGVCTEAAPRIAGALSREHGWKVTRVGTRVRNPLLGMPDAWEQKILAQFQKLTDDGETVGGMEHAEIVEEPDGRFFRYMRAIEVRQPCLVCHGPEDGIPDDVKVMLAERYPFDEARNYRVGELRGAVSIKRPVTD